MFLKEMSSPKLLLFIADDYEKYNNFDDLQENNYDFFVEPIKYVCPFCGMCKEDEFFLREGEDDYVSYPMYWAPCCNATSVISINSFCKLTLEEAQLGFPRFSHVLQEWASETPNSFFVVLEFLKIKRISNFQLYKYELTDKNMTDDEIKYFVETKEKKEERKKLMEEFGIRKKNNPYSCLDKDPELYRLSLPVDSYDIEFPSKPYPRNMILSHDAITIYIICKDESGNDFRVSYWGD